MLYWSDMAMYENKTALNHSWADYPGCALITLGTQGVQSELQKGLDGLQSFPIKLSSMATPA